MLKLNAEELATYQNQKILLDITTTRKVATFRWYCYR